LQRYREKPSCNAAEIALIHASRSEIENSNNRLFFTKPPLKQRV
jgi:hypothetical protein